MYSLCVCVVFRLNLVNSTKMVVWKEFVTKSVGLGQQQQVRQEISQFNNFGPLLACLSVRPSRLPDCTLSRL